MIAFSPSLHHTDSHPMPYLFLFLTLFFSACALSPTQLADTSTDPDGTTRPNKPVQINEAAVPTFGTPASSSTSPAPITGTQPSTTTPAIPTTQRKYSFRTPDLVNELPPESALENKPDFSRVIEESIPDSTTIRATD